MFSRLMGKTALPFQYRCFVHASDDVFKGKNVHTFLFLLNNNAPVKKETSNCHLNTDRIFCVK